MSRSCVADKDSISERCIKPSTKIPVQCAVQTCNSDGCNGGAAQYGPMALLIALPVAIAKIYVL